MERKSTAVAGPVLEVKNLSVSFRMYDRGLEQYDLKVISNLNLDVRPGEIVAVAGSSGSGKSLLAHAVMGLCRKTPLWKGRFPMEESSWSKRTWNGSGERNLPWFLSRSPFWILP